MPVRQTLRPGRRGTRRFAARYGDRLVCVRYRYDVTHERRYTTIERIVDEGAWTPAPSPGAIWGLRVVWGEAEFDVLVTLYTTMRHQQHLPKYDLAVVHSQR